MSEALLTLAYLSIRYATLHLEYLEFMYPIVLLEMDKLNRKESS
jgi:hypothetical protein